MQRTLRQTNLAIGVKPYSKQTKAWKVNQLLQNQQCTKNEGVQFGDQWTIRVGFIVVRGCPTWQVSFLETRLFTGLNMVARKQTWEKRNLLVCPYNPFLINQVRLPSSKRNLAPNILFWAISLSLSLIFNLHKPLLKISILVFSRLASECFTVNPHQHCFSHPLIAIRRTPQPIKVLHRFLSQYSQHCVHLLPECSLISRYAHCLNTCARPYYVLRKRCRTHPQFSTTFRLLTTCYVIPLCYINFFQ